MRCEIVSTCPQPESAGDSTSGSTSHVEVTISESPDVEHQDDNDSHEAPHTGSIYYLVGRNTQEVPIIGSMVPAAATRHWAARVKWWEGNDLVWEVFQDGNRVILSGPSSYAEVQYRFDQAYPSGSTTKTAEEVDYEGELSLIFPDLHRPKWHCGHVDAQWLTRKIARTITGHMGFYHSVASNCQTFVQTLAKAINNGVWWRRLIDAITLESPRSIESVVSDATLGLASGRAILLYGMLWRTFGPGATTHEQQTDEGLGATEQSDVDEQDPAMVRTRPRARRRAVVLEAL